MSVLYLEPMIYVPYEISLRKKDAIKIKDFYIIDGEKLPVKGYKAKRMPNKNFIYLEFSNPLYIDVTTLEGTDNLISILIHYELNLDGKTISVRHLRHLLFSKPNFDSGMFNQFNMKHAHITFFGIEGKKVAEKKNLHKRGSLFREILQFGLDGKDHEYKKWAIETIDLLTPNEELLHGTLH